MVVSTARSWKKKSNSNKYNYFNPVKIALRTSNVKPYYFVLIFEILENLLNLQDLLCMNKTERILHVNLDTHGCF